MIFGIVVLIISIFVGRWFVTGVSKHATDVGVIGNLIRYGKDLWDGMLTSHVFFCIFQSFFFFLLMQLNIGLGLPKLFFF